MKKLIITTFLMVLFFLKTIAIPRPDHVVVCILENKGYPQIIGSSSAPYINSLVPLSANLKKYYALTHPSQPNYIMLYSGKNQGVTTNSTPSGTPWNTLNLGGSLINNGFTFKGYAEGLPSIGSTVSASGSYVRRHNPWVNWQGSGTNRIPRESNVPMTSWPTNFNSLPTVSFVVPNLNNDMHDESISRGDTWVKTKLKTYIDWCKTHNSIFILMFDEDNDHYGNRVVCLIMGMPIKTGSYSTGYNHYDLLRTIEAIYGLPYAGQSFVGKTMTTIWKSVVTTDIEDNSYQIAHIVDPVVYPNPINLESILKYYSDESGTSELSIYDISGRLVSTEVILTNVGENNYNFIKDALRPGYYIYLIIRDDHNTQMGEFVFQ